MARLVREPGACIAAVRVPTAVSGGVSMTTEEKLDWLQSLCAHDRKLIATPFSATVDGKRYIAATDGHLAVGLELPGVVVRDDGPDFASVWKPGVWVPADLGWIRNWAYRDRKIDRSECWSCDGEGYVKTTLIAFDKEGNGPFENLYEKCDECCTGIRPGVIAGVQFNRELVAKAVARLPCERAEWSLKTDKLEP